MTTRTRVTRGAWVFVGLVVASRSAQGQVPTECVGSDAVPYECFVDATCPLASNYAVARRSVVHVSGPDRYGTGVLINNVDCVTGYNDPDCGAPYLLTAAHMFTDFWDPYKISDNVIYSLENEYTFTLGFASAFCGGVQPVYSIAVGGCKVVGYSTEKDLMLVRLDTTIPIEAAPYYAGWGTKGVGISELAAIGHPCAGTQKVAITGLEALEFEQAIAVDWLKVDSWEVGGLLEGSSGGPLFTDQGSMIGIFAKQDEDSCTGDKTSTYFVAQSSIVSFLGDLANAKADWDGYDPLLTEIPDAVASDAYFGNGDVATINATQKVILYDGFHADVGSNVHVIIVPAGP